MDVRLVFSKTLRNAPQYNGAPPIRLLLRELSLTVDIRPGHNFTKESAMSLLDSLKDVLNQYGNSATQNSAKAPEHFDQVSQVAPPNLIAEGLAAVFHSDQTPAFGNLVGSLFSQSSGQQKAGLLNQLLASVGPSALSQLAGGGALASLLNGAKQITPEQANQIPPDVVQQIATHAEKSDPSIIDKASAFYAEHPTLIKTLGGAALSIALAKVAERQKAA